MQTCGAVMSDTTECGSTMQYIPGAKFICTQPAGHKGPHFDAEGPVSWTSSVAVIPPRDTTRPG